MGLDWASKEDMALGKSRTQGSEGLTVRVRVHVRLKKVLPPVVDVPKRRSFRRDSEIRDVPVPFFRRSSQPLHDVTVRRPR